MGALYGREIHGAVETTKKLFIFLAAIQVLKVIILALILLAMLALLVTMNPDLEDERGTVVTPAVKWIIHRLSNVVPVRHFQGDEDLPRADTIEQKIQQVTRRERR
jgi:hypothetical protein